MNHHVIQSPLCAIVAALCACSACAGEAAPGPFKISRSAEWIPLSDTTDIAPGSALDFSKLGWIDAPAARSLRTLSFAADTARDSSEATFLYEIER